MPPGAARRVRPAVRRRGGARRVKTTTDERRGVAPTAAPIAQAGRRRAAATRMRNGTAAPSHRIGAADERTNLVSRRQRCACVYQHLRNLQVALIRGPQQRHLSPL